MTKKTIIAALLACASFSTANAGGMLTNTNQSIAFLRNPARDATIGIDGVYNNPAGVALLPEGFHVGINWQMAVQKRSVETTSPLLDHTLNGKKVTKKYAGHASAPCIPSVGAAYNHKKWSYQFNFAVSGGGGKCEFTKGLGTFENAVGAIAMQLKNNTSLQQAGIDAAGYGVDNYMEGRQYYFGVTLGAAYKLVDKKDMKLSVYGGLRGLLANASYQAQIKDIQVATKKYGLQNLADYIDNPEFQAIKNQAGQIYQTYGAQYSQLKAAQAAGRTTPQQDQVIAAIEGYQQLSALDQYKNGVDLTCDQSGFGIAPLFSVDFQYKRINLAAKYEFRTKMSLKNESNLMEATIPATGQFVNGGKVREDSPAMLALGVMYTPVDIVRVGVGYHHFYDRKSQKYGNKQDLLDGGTNEYLAGVSVDVTDRLIVSCGAQITRYGNTDEYISDLSFVTDSWSFGFGASYQANPNVKIEAAYFRTQYGTYDSKNNVGGITVNNSFTRTNDVIGAGLVMNF